MFSASLGLIIRLKSPGTARAKTQQARAHTKTVTDGHANKQNVFILNENVF